ncbi:hypothetical protein L249_4783 [Ophiocordyceps polyrhachis-furcata BCC 54312]|uniref:Protein kinase domain-containing protein n=1 Tax=Ophiocordyceps polyrhachis-furcata BCC 54312 TaxID=1330021 RepID=A0A367L2X9_9HYPO|nr:hypothetical protein L249_4783 [Ophiocordyceps polyrhachis-furcata BCC 54312]
MPDVEEKSVGHVNDIHLEKLPELISYVTGAFAHILCHRDVPHRLRTSLDKQAARFKGWSFVAGFSVNNHAAGRLGNAPAMLGALLAALEYLSIQLRTVDSHLDGQKTPSDGASSLDATLEIESAITTLHQLSISYRRTVLPSPADLLVQLHQSHGQDATAELSIKLLSKRLWSAFSSGYFIPDESLRNVVDEVSTQQVLFETFPEFHSTKFEAYSKLVCQEPGLRKIFALLVLLRKVSALESFIESSINDGCLPLPANGNQLRPSLTDDETRDQFVQLQWLLLAPQLIRNHDNDTASLHRSAIVPCLEAVVIPKFNDNLTDQTSTQTIVLESSPVWKVKIHPGHIAASRRRDVPLCALKQLKGLSKRDAVCEIANLKELRYLTRPQEHMVELLDSFFYRDNFYLVFDWAQDNLLQYWRRNAEPESTKGLFRWASSQMLGLSQGLAAFHDELRGFHGDITPHNILRFTKSDSPRSYGILKLSDFGLAQFLGRGDQEEHFYDMHCDPTYQPPECQPPEEPGDVHTNVTQKSDIWSLGCVYMNFVTWLLRGSKGVEEFSRQRLDEHGTDLQINSFFKVTGEARPVLKATVIRRIEEFESLEKQTQFTLNVMRIIKDNMLTLNPRTRLSCRALSDRLLDIDKKCQDEQHGPGEEMAVLVQAPWVECHMSKAYIKRKVMQRLLKKMFPQISQVIRLRDDCWVLRLPRGITQFGTKLSMASERSGRIGG